MVRAVIFDYGNVIASFDYAAFFETIGCGTGKTPEALEEAYAASGIHREYEKGALSSDAFYDAAARTLGLSVGKGAFFAAYTDIFTPIATTADLIRTLKPRYRIGLLSNTNAWHFEHVIRPNPVFGLFDSVTLSFEVGALKPDAAVYRDAVEKLRVPAGECVFIDDIEEYAQGARNAGMAGIRYVSHGGLLKELEARGVSVG